MNVTTTTKRLLLEATLPAAALAAALALWAPGRGEAVGNPDLRPAFGLAGIVQSQTLRLAAANVAIGNPDTRPACRVRLSFADIAGRAVGPEPHIAELAPGQGTFVDLEAGAVGNPDIRQGGRAEVRAVALGGPDTHNCRLAFSAEIFGPGGNKTEIYMQAPPEPD